MRMMMGVRRKRVLRRVVNMGRRKRRDERREHSGGDDVDGEPLGFVSRRRSRDGGAVHVDERSRDGVQGCAERATRST